MDIPVSVFKFQVYAQTFLGQGLVITVHWRAFFAEFSNNSALESILGRV